MGWPGVPEPHVIEEMEAAGQKGLVESIYLPAHVMYPDTYEDIEALGIVLGDALATDRTFRSAVLPDGWRKVPSDHSMWSYIEDAGGARRVAIFYKAAPYDRDAFMRVVKDGEPA